MSGYHFASFHHHTGLTPNPTFSRPPGGGEVSSHNNTPTKLEIGYPYISPKPCKRLKYVGDFNEEGLESPTKAKLVVTVATEELNKKLKIIKTLHQKECRMQKRLKTFQEVT
ncbi:hypothetical protein AVEN_105687-1 [Araneus ventricosus]|uniref:Uncharacterized protein n=1 Tax=Araneus ventricosus TaxID=182803 RepID=A0A4Y2QDX4_ARAVE|nr:hypothetical protein AVEN_15290-1 [Araneus ventricosus]GBN61432.1 hypothetical protein AVEN_105687-1 [Araneus ventricosus]